MMKKWLFLICTWKAMCDTWMLVSWKLVYSFSTAATKKNDYQLDNLKQQIFIFLQFWKWKVWQDVGRVDFFWNCQKKFVISFFLTFWRLSAIFVVSWNVDTVLQAPPSAFLELLSSVFKPLFFSHGHVSLNLRGTCSVLGDTHFEILHLIML